MKIKILERNEEKMKFVLEGATLSFANALRRVMVSSVPTMSVDWVDFQDNEGALFDEMLVHRIGLIPLTFEQGKYNLPDECTCGGKGCPSCQVVLVIDKKGPTVVLSKDMKSTDKKVKPLYDNIPLTEIGEGKSVKLEAVARLGIGLKHAKNQAAIAVCQPYPKIEKASGVDAKKVVGAFPKGVLSLSGTKIEITDPVRLDEFSDVVDSFKGKVSVATEEGKFVFSIESVCGLPPEKIVEKAAEVISSKSEEFKKLVSKI